MLTPGQVVRTPDGRLWRVLSVDNMGATIRTLKGHGRQNEHDGRRWESPRTLLISARSVLPIVEENQ